MAMLVDVQFACEDAGVPEEREIQSWVEFAARESGRLPDGDAKSPCASWAKRKCRP